MTRASRVALALILILAPGCAQPIVWEDRNANDPQDKAATQPVPTCPQCGQVVDWEGDRCSNPEQPIRLRWTKQPGLE